MGSETDRVGADLARENQRLPQQRDECARLVQGRGDRIKDILSSCPFDAYIVTMMVTVFAPGTSAQVGQK